MLRNMWGWGGGGVWWHGWTCTHVWCYVTCGVGVGVGCDDMVELAHMLQAFLGHVTCGGGVWWHRLPCTHVWCYVTCRVGVGVGCDDSVNALVKGKVHAALYEYLYSWLWRYSHIPHDCNVNDCLTKLRHSAANKKKVLRKRFVVPPPVKCLKSDNRDEPLKNP